MTFLTIFYCEQLFSEQFPTGRVEFMGVFTHTVHWLPFDKQKEAMQEILVKNPDIKGVCIRAPWCHFAPSKEKVETAAFEELVRFLRAKGLPVYVALIPGSLCTPEWVFEDGAKKVMTVGSWAASVPYTVVPWDPVYMKHWESFIAKIAPLIEAENGIFAVDVLGHSAMMEMHMPKGEENMIQWRKLGWTREKVEENWKHWVDFFATQFSKKQLCITLSEMYGADSSGMPTLIATYALDKYPGRILLTNHQLHGRFVYLNADDPQHGAQVKFRNQAFSGWECVGSWWQQPDRQGSVELLVLNALQANPLFIQIWNRDAMTNPEYATRIARCFEEYSRMPPNELETRLKKEGKYKTRAEDAYKVDGKPGADDKLISPSKEKYPDLYKKFHKGYLPD